MGEHISKNKIQAILWMSFELCKPPFSVLIEVPTAVEHAMYVASQVGGKLTQFGSWTDREIMICTIITDNPIVHSISRGIEIILFYVRSENVCGIAPLLPVTNFLDSSLNVCMYVS